MKSSYLLWSHVLVFILLTAWTSEALIIDPPFPATLTVNQPITFGWARESTTPKLLLEFDFVVNNGTQAVPLNADDTDRTSGVVTVTPTVSGAVEIQALGRDDRNGPPTSTFFRTTAAIEVPTTTSAPTESPSSVDISQTNTSTSSTSSTRPGASPFVLSPTTSTSLVNNTSNSSNISFPPTPTGTETSTPSAATTSSDTPTTAGPTSASQGANPSEGAMNARQRGIIIGSVIGGVVLILLILLLLLCLRRRRRRQGGARNAEGDDVFYRDKMVLEPVARRLSLNVGFGLGKKSRDKETDRIHEDDEGALGNGTRKRPDSPSTPLREGFEDGDADTDTQQSHSVYSRSSRPSHEPVSNLGLGLTSTSRFIESQSPPPVLGAISNRSSSRVRTDRQMQIEQKIIELQSRLITATGSPQEKNRTRAELRERIEKVKELRESDWALEEDGDTTNVPPLLRG